jgi:hypothetical protein
MTFIFFTVFSTAAVATGNELLMMSDRICESEAEA